MPQSSIPEVFPPACIVCGLSALETLTDAAGQTKPICGPCKQRGHTGLGDVVKKVTAAFGIQPCGSCQKRADKLNRLVRF